MGRRRWRRWRSCAAYRDAAEEVDHADAFVAAGAEHLTVQCADPFALEPAERLPAAAGV